MMDPRLPVWRLSTLYDAVPTGSGFLASIALRHQDAVMRTTIDVPDDLHSIVQSLASSTRRSLSATASELMRRGLALPSADPGAPAGEEIAPQAPFKSHPVTGLPVFRMLRQVTPEDVAALDDK